MKEIINHSKTTPPKLFKVLHRERLIETIEGYRDRKAILVLGQAAQGKSTFVASYCQKCKRNSAWINLTEEESDPLNLFRLIVHSVQNALKKDDFSDLLKYVSADLGPREQTPLFRRWAYYLVQRISSRVQIILDGLERLSPDSSSFGLLEKLLEEADSKVRFVLLSRKEPPLNIQKLYMRREAAVIDNGQLAFTIKETEAFFNETCRIPLPSKQARQIHAMTEGWVGGLLIFSEALERRPEKVREKFLSEVFIGEVKQKAFQYLGEEIFSSLKEEVKDFLIKSSILEVIDPVLVGELLETNNAGTTLNRLGERNFFIQTLYHPRHGLLFRYHQVFRDFLTSRYNLKTPREEKQRLHSKAARAFERIEDYETALGHYLKAQDHLAASNTLERIGMNLFAQGRIGDLAQRLRSIPEEFVQKNPWLLLYLCMTRRFTATGENAKILPKCIRIFEKRDDARGQILSLALLLEAFLLSGHHPVPVKDLVVRAEMLMDSVSQDLYTHERGILWCQVGQALTVCCGNPRRGYWACKKAYLVANQCGDINLQVSALTRAIEAVAWLGEFELVDELILEFRNFIDHTYPELLVPHLFVLSELSLLKGELEKAREQSSQAQAIVEKHGLIYWHPPVLAADLAVSILTGKMVRAESIANYLLEMALSMKNIAFEGVATFYTAWIADCQGEWKRAKELVEHSAKLLSSDESLTLWHCHMANVLRSLILNHLGDINETDEGHYRAIDNFTSVSSYIFLADAHLAMALRKRKQGKDDKAAFHLKAGLGIAEDKNYHHFFILSREEFADACVLALELNVPEAVSYASHLISTYFSDLADSKLKKLENHKDKTVASQAGNLRKTIYFSIIPRLRIQCFGNFQVWRGDKVIEDEEWQRTQPKNLLKALVSRGAWKTSREVLMEDIWPESEARAAEKNFKVTLHRLRKTLEPEMKQAYGSSYVHLRDHRLFLDRELCSIDIDDFLDLTFQGKKEEDKENFESALSFYSRAVDLYKGDFLEQDLYAPWAESKREKFRKILTDILSRMGTILEQQDKTEDSIGCYQRIIRVDPCIEEAYRKMMSLYAKLKMRNAALKTYHDCRKALQNELDSEPDEITVEIYRKIAEKK